MKPVIAKTNIRKGNILLAPIFAATLLPELGLFNITLIIAILILITMCYRNPTHTIVCIQLLLL